MPDPAHLAQEVVDYIFDYATNGNAEVKSLANFCHVDRQWYAIAKPRFYKRWTYHGETHSISSLWNPGLTVTNKSWDPKNVHSHTRTEEKLKL